jgi:hypothetical protein
MTRKRKIETTEEALLTDLDNTALVLDELIKIGTEHRPETTWRYDIKAQRYGYFPTGGFQGKPRWSYAQTDPLIIARESLRRAMEQMALGARPKLKAMTDAVVAKINARYDAAEKECQLMIGAAGAAAIRTRKEAKEAARKEAAEILKAAKAEAAKVRRDAANEAAKKREAAEMYIVDEVNRRVDRMYGRAGNMARPRKLGIAPGKKLVLVDDD